MAGQVSGDGVIVGELEMSWAMKGWSEVRVVGGNGLGVTLEGPPPPHPLPLTECSTFSAHPGLLRGRRCCLGRGRALLVPVRVWGMWGAAWGCGGGLRAQALSPPPRLQRELRLTQKVDYVVPPAPGAPTAPSASVGARPLPSPARPAPAWPSRAPRHPPAHSLGTSGWHAMPRCTTTSTRGSSCGACSGEWPRDPHLPSAPPPPLLAPVPAVLPPPGTKNHPGSLVLPLRTRKTKTGTSQSMSAQAWPR